MTHRMMITLPDPLGEQLDEHAARNGQRPSTVAAELVRDALNHLAETKSRPRSASRSPTSEHSAPWIEPTDETRNVWRSETWMAILALYARYAKELARLENEWWQQPSRIETLAALAEWRNQLDHGATDPREELAFQARIAELQYTLEHTPGIGADTFNPSTTPPPHEWLNG
jgi:Arc/MetJ-type ribon-helix-helix transcriptional regulator